MINNNKLLPWIVLFSAATFFFYEFLHMNLLNSIAEPLKTDFALTDVSIAFLSDLHLLGTIIFLLPSGLIIDHFQPRRVLLITLSAAIIATFIFSNTTSPFIAGVCQFFGGIGDAFSFLILITLASRWFSSEKIALAIGVATPFAMLGGVVAETPLTLLCQAIGWRHSLQIIAVLGIVILINAYFFVENYPNNKKKISPTIKQIQGIMEKLKSVINNRQNWYCGFYTGMLNLPIMIFDSLYGNSYFSGLYHLTTDQASYINTAIFIGTIIGAPFLGYISNRFHSRIKPMKIGVLLSIISVILLVLPMHFTFYSLLLLFFMMGFATSAQVLSYSVITDSNPSELSSTATGFAAVIIMSIGAIAQPLFGRFIIFRHNVGTIDTSIAHPSNLNQGLVFLLISFIISLLVSFFIKETFVKSPVLTHN